MMYANDQQSRSQMWIIAGVLIVALLLSTACAPLDPSMQVSAQTTGDDMETVVNDIWREYEASIEAGDAVRWGELWVEDGVKFPPDGAMLEGKAAIVDNMVAWMEMATARDVAITNQSIETAGDFAFLRGLFTVDATLNANGAPVLMDGKYMSIIQRQPDGSWKLYRDIFNSNVPPAAANPPATDPADITTAVEDVWAEYSGSLNEGDAARWAALWLDDGVQLPPGGMPKEGKELITSGLADELEALDYDMVIKNVEVIHGSDVAVARGFYTATVAPKDGSQDIYVDGKYMSVLKRQPDGSWKLYRDIFNSNVPPAGPADDLEAVTAAVEANWEEYSAALNADDAERWAALWLDDGVQMPPGTALREGKATIAEAVGASMDAFAYDMEITNQEVLLSGDMAVARGLYSATLTPKAGGDDVYIDGKYMSVLMRQPDGTWKLYRDIFNSNVP